MRTRSKGSRASASSASRPFVTASARQPSAPACADATFWFTGLSSAISTRSGASARRRRGGAARSVAARSREHLGERVAAARLPHGLREPGIADADGRASAARASRSTTAGRAAVARAADAARIARRGPPVHLGHLHVEDDEAEGSPASAAGAARRAPRRRSPTSTARQPHAAQLLARICAVRGVVVDHEHAQAGELGGRACARARRVRCGERDA